MGLLFMAGGILAIIVSTILIFLFFWKLHHLKLARSFPGPPALPLIGNALMFAGVDHNEMIQVISRLQTKLGSPARIWFGPHLVISIADPQNMEIIMKSSENLNKSIHHRYFRDFMNGVFLAKDERWKKLRKLMNSMFHTSSMEEHVQIFYAQSKIMCDILEEKVGKGVFDIRDTLNDCILDIICQTAMRIPMNIQLNKDLNVTFNNDVSHLSEIIMQRVSKIWLYPNLIFDRTKLGRERDKLVKKILDFIKLFGVVDTQAQDINRLYSSNHEKLYDNHLSSLTTKGAGPSTKCPKMKINYRKPYLDLMLEYGARENLSDEELALQINDLMVAGSDTSGVAASYALVMLGMDQKLQDRVYCELQEIFGDSDRPATMEDIYLMTQLEMVVKETIRITCPPHMARTVQKDVQLPGSASAQNMIVPAGSTLYMMLYNMHRNPKYWTRPNEFYPDHFLPENEAARPKYSYLPFSYGLRMCPGHKYGIYSLKVILSTVLRRFKVISDLKPNELRYRVAIMLELANGYPLQLEPRTSSR
ncbi:cytochrome P450 4C1-like [Lycorma delicatula]|uniref:cytochrome P450 4C1-like n=1 Tax=Lycorma delicatula TaxID=130591 RepID=UPI003F516481